MAWTTNIVIVGVCILVANCAPKSRDKNLPQTVYDQKQTGDYNIQLHLKDFQIIALLADDTIGGDYDYNYDYADFTIKPSGSTTAKPNITVEAPEEPQTSNHPYPILLPATSEKPAEPPVLNSTVTVKIEEKPILSSTTEAVEINSPGMSLAEAEVSSPGKIKVQILESPGSPHVGIVPGEDIGELNTENLPIGDAPIKRCNTGYARDKRGRCRRLRRPGGSHQLPFGISRLATNLAARFRYAASDSSNID